MTVEIPLTRGLVAIIDDEDFALVSRVKWHAIRPRSGRTWYACGALYGERLIMHRYILGLKPGDIRKGDHRDGDGLNNTRQNLRVATKHQNHQNTPIRSDNTIGFKGVMRNHKRFSAMIGGDYLGTFDTAFQAALVYDKAARKRYGAFACLNCPRPGERSALTGEIMPLQVAA